MTATAFLSLFEAYPTPFQDGTTVFRGSWGGTMPRDISAARVLRYEIRELGNFLHSHFRDILPQLEKRPGSDLVWVCLRHEDALCYTGDAMTGGAPNPKEVRAFTLPAGSTILADDGEGGYLILKGSGLTNPGGIFTKKPTFTRR